MRRSRPAARNGLLAVPVLAVLLAAFWKPPEGAATISPGGGDTGSYVIDFDAILRSIDTADQRALRGDKSVIPELEKDIRDLTLLLGDPALSAYGKLAVQYYRGMGGSQLAWARARLGLKPVRAIAENAAIDFRAAYEATKDDQKSLAASAAYGLATVYFNHLDDEATSYKYFAICSDLGHAGCWNVMAGAYETGGHGVAKDLSEAIKLHRKVYETGTKYTCAGAFSSLGIANILVWDKVDGVTETWSDWMRRAYVLLDELGANGLGENICDRGSFLIDEYLMELTSGAKKPQLLQAALGRAQKPTTRLVALFLLGQVDEDTFLAQVAGHSVSYEQCGAYQKVAWAAGLAGNARFAARLSNAALANSGGGCGLDVLERFKLPQ